MTTCCSQDGSGDSGGSAETEVQASDLNEQHSSEAQEDLQERRDSHEQTSTSGALYSQLKQLALTMSSSQLHIQQLEKTMTCDCS